MRGSRVLLAAAAAAVAASAYAQNSVAALEKALDLLRADKQWTLDQQISLCEIPAPPFMEQKRGAEYARRLQAAGLANVRSDAAGNVYGELRGTGAAPIVMLSAHLDTVFPPETDVRVKRQGARLLGPGISDDCRGLAVVLAVARAFQKTGVRPRGTILFTGTVGEEGQGNLRGVRHIFEKEWRGKIDYFISVDGPGLGLTSRGVGSNRYKITFKGPGGHSYGAFGMPNPVHALGRAAAKIADIKVPAKPKTTFNIGTISGGTSVNSIAFAASMEIDLRSESPDSLKELDAQVRKAVDEAVREERARWPKSAAALDAVIDVIGIRPAAEQSDDAAIVRAAQDAARKLGIAVGATRASSTDSNLPMSMGVPSITIDGGGRGGNAHSLNEWYEETADSFLGPQWAARIVLELANRPR